MHKLTAGGHDYFLVDSDVDLAAVCYEQAKNDWVAVDTEFERSSTYYPELCLVQLTTIGQVAVIDPLAIQDMGPLVELIFNSRITKVFHAGRQDLEIFHHLYDRVPTPIFDTQIAAQLLGLEEQSSYATLVKHLLGVELDKSHTRTNWKIRPLSGGQLKYAAEDVIYLAQVYELIRQRLSDAGILEWLKDDFAALQSPALYDVDPYDCWRRIRQARRLSESEVAVLQQLAAWREMTARLENIPRNWLLSDHLLVDLSRLQPQSSLDLTRMQGLNKRFLAKHGSALLHLIATADRTGKKDLVQAENRQPLGMEQKRLVEKMFEVVQQKQRQYNLRENSIVTQKGLEALVRNGANAQLQQGWRYQLVGKELFALLEHSDGC